MSVLFVVESALAQELRSRIDRVALASWRDEGQILFFTAPDANRTGKELAANILEYLDGKSVADVWIQKRLKCDIRQLQLRGLSVSSYALKTLLQGDNLFKYLKRFGLDWKMAAQRKLCSYASAEITESHVAKWLLQFDHLGNHRWVGEVLLRLLDVMPAHEVGDALAVDGSFFSDQLIFAFNKDRWGKSWETINGHLVKRHSGLNLQPISEAIVVCKSPSRIKLIEDGLFSGTEMKGIFDSLLNERNGRAPKVTPLSDPSILRKVALGLRFSVICDYGDQILAHFLAKKNLLNISIDHDAARRRIRVLRPNSDKAKPISEGVPSQFTDTFTEQLRSRIEPEVFQHTELWGDKIDRAKSFCREIGGQLWQNYLYKKNYLTGWPPDRVQRCALGMEGLGLAFAFAHSVPKATLPLFWGRGPVYFGGNEKVNWIPLFENADT